MPRPLVRVIYAAILLGCLGQAFVGVTMAAPPAASDAGAPCEPAKTYTIRIDGEGRLDQPIIVIEAGDSVIWNADDFTGGYQVIVSDSGVDQDLAFKIGAYRGLKSKPIRFGSVGRVPYRAGKIEGVIRIVDRVSNANADKSAGNTAEELTPNRIVVRHGDVSGALKQSPNKKLTVQATADSIQLVDAVNERLVGSPLRMARGTTVDCWAFSPDGRLIAAGGGHKGNAKGSTDNKGLVYVWEVATGRLYAAIDGGRQYNKKELFGYVTALAFNNDSTLVFVKAEKFYISGR